MIFTVLYIFIVLCILKFSLFIVGLFGEYGVGLSFTQRKIMLVSLIRFLYETCASFVSVFTNILS